MYPYTQKKNERRNNLIARHFNLPLGHDRLSEKNVKQKIEILRGIINEEDLSGTFRTLYSEYKDHTFEISFKYL